MTTLTSVLKVNREVFFGYRLHVHLGPHACTAARTMVRVTTCHLRVELREAYSIVAAIAVAVCTLYIACHAAVDAFRKGSNLSANLEKGYLKYAFFILNIRNNA